MTSLNRILSKLEDVQPSGSGYMARCPAHDDSTPSLSITPAANRVLLKCFAGCSAQAIVRRLGLELKDLFDSPFRVQAYERWDDETGPIPKGVDRQSSKGELTACYPYVDASGKECFQVRRYERGGKKSFLQYHRDEKGNLRPGLRRRDGTRIQPLLYNLPAVLEAARSGSYVAIVEGEKDAERLMRESKKHSRIGRSWTVTTSPMGAGSWRDEFADAFVGCRGVCVIPDNDEPGRAHAEAIVESLHRREIHAVIVRIDGLPPKGDLSDAFDGRLYEQMPEDIRPAFDPFEHIHEAILSAVGHHEMLAEQARVLYGGSARLVVGQGKRVDEGPSETSSAMETGSQDLDEDLPELPGIPYWAFPLQALPYTVRQMVEAQSEAIPCDPAFVAVPALAAMAAGVGNRYRAVIKRGWRETGAIWTGVIAPSGSAKSPALEAAMDPIYELESEAAKAHIEALREYRQLLADAKAKRQSDPSVVDPQPPRRQRYRTQNATTEALLSIVADTEGAVIQVFDELAAWFDFDRYSRGSSDVQTHIELHGGRPITVDRKTGEQRVLLIERPAVTVTGTTQPGILRRRLSDDLFESGFAARLLLTMPPSKIKLFSSIEPPVRAIDAYRNTIRGLYRLRPLEVGEADLSFTADARAIFARHHDQNAHRAAEMPEGAMRAVLNKVPGHVARIALALHLSDHVEHQGVGAVPGPISKECVVRAIHIVEWFAREMSRVMASLTKDAAPTAEERLLDSLPEDEFTTSEFQAMASMILHLPERTARHRLQSMVADARLDKLGRGRYRLAQSVRTRHRAYRVAELPDLPELPVVPPPDDQQGGNQELTGQALVLSILG